MDKIILSNYSIEREKVLQKRLTWLTPTFLLIFALKDQSKMFPEEEAVVPRHSAQQQPA
jgi:hypothetical protein